MRCFRYILLSVVLLMAGSCVLEESVVLPVEGDNLIELSSSKMRIITRSGDSAQKFDEGTTFRLFAVQNGTDWSSEGTKFYNLQGTGDSSGNIAYSIDGKKASYDVGKNLDFYGVTYGSASDIIVEGSSGEAPKVTVSLVGSVFPDLMYSDNLKGKNSSSGLLNMEFRHALSKLKFEILKQDESADSDKKLENVVLKKVVLKGSATSAVFNVKEGIWSYDDSCISDRIVYENASGLPIGSSPSMLKTGDDVIEMLVVPNSGELMLEVTVDVDGDSSTDDDKVVDYTLMSTETEHLRLSQNHEYTLSIVVLKNDVRVVTVTPKVYDWIDVEVGSDDTYFGQPSYFGGLMWMDRNLGASSADCENDWYNSIGYYYQHGRNIPYILDVEGYLASSDKKFTYKTVSGSKTDPDGVLNLQHLYTYDQNGNKVTTVKHANHSSGSCLYGNIAITPGDEGDYSYIRGYIYKKDGKNTLYNRSWAKKDLSLQIVNDSQVTEGFDHEIFWHDVERQPCPKGWRLPGKVDMFSFMPESTKLNWADSYVHGDDMLSQDPEPDPVVLGNYKTGNTNAAGEEYEWRYFAGKFKIDSSADKSSDFTYPVSDKYARVYGIKYEGENKAYRVMFEQKPYKNDISKTFVRISRFSSEKEDRFEISDDGTQWNIHQFDWSTPVEYMDIPLAGFMSESGLSNFGEGTILRAWEGDGRGNNWTLYLRSDYNGVAVAGKSRRMLGDQIRCVRDVNAEW